MFYLELKFIIYKHYYISLKQLYYIEVVVVVSSSKRKGSICF